MLEPVAVNLIVLWLLGLVSSYIMGGFIHVMLVIAVVVVLLRIIRRWAAEVPGAVFAPGLRAALGDGVHNSRHARREF